MKVVIKTNSESAKKTLALWLDEQAGYYGRPWGCDGASGLLVGGKYVWLGEDDARVEARMAELLAQPLPSVFAWRRSSGAIAEFRQADGGWLFSLRGRRHAVLGITRDVEELGLVEYQTREPAWAWWETLDSKRVQSELWGEAAKHVFKKKPGQKTWLGIDAIGRSIVNRLRHCNWPEKGWMQSWRLLKQALYEGRPVDFVY